jgi:hypothetical protein
MIEVSAKFSADADLARVVNALEGAGVKLEAVQVLTREPLARELPASRSSRMPLIAVCGAVSGFFTAIALVGGTSMAYRLPTGGMPLVPPMTTGVITYELTMLGAVLGSVITLIVEGGLGPGRDLPPSADLSQGDALISVRCAGEQCRRVRDLLEHELNNIDPPRRSAP